MMNIARTAMGAMLCLSATATVAGEDHDSGPRNVQLGTRPYYLIEGLKPGENITTAPKQPLAFNFLLDDAAKARRIGTCTTPRWPPSVTAAPAGTNRSIA